MRDAGDAGGGAVKRPTTTVPDHAPTRGKQRLACIAGGPPATPGRNSYRPRAAFRRRVEQDAQVLVRGPNTAPPG